MALMGTAVKPRIGEVEEQDFNGYIKIGCSRFTRKFGESCQLHETVHRNRFRSGQSIDHRSAGQLHDSIPKSVHKNVSDLFK